MKSSFLSSVNLSNLAQSFLDESLRFKGNTPQTIGAFRQLLKNFLDHSGAVSLEDMNRMVIKHYIMKRANERQWSPKTIKNHLVTLSLFCDWLQSEGLISSNPVKTIKKPKQKKVIRPFLTLEQAETLLDCARVFPGTYHFEKPRAYAIVATFLFTGIRRTELLNLQLDHVMFDQEDLLVKQGKGQKDRIIPMNSRLVDILKIYLSERKTRDKSTPYFFTSLRDDIRMGENALKRLFQKLKGKTGLDLYPHLLRHTFATHLIQQGVALPNVSRFLGHADIQSTIPYIHAASSRFKGDIAKLPYG